MKTAFGLAHASVRAGRGMTASDWCAETGIAMRTLYAVEAGRLPVTAEFVNALVEPCVLSTEERCRLVAGWADAGIEGSPVRYELRPVTDAGHRVAAYLAAFLADLDDCDLDRIHQIVRDRVCGVAA